MKKEKEGFVCSVCKREMVVKSVKYTPPTWEWRCWGDGQMALVSNGMRIMGAFDNDKLKRDMPNSANARLIAAAPDMLEALKGMLEWARRVKESNPGPEVSTAITAIKKALGE
jgi:hypothetical protein